jgi:branched-chain amino acid transport system permease protein
MKTELGYKKIVAFLFVLGIFAVSPFVLPSYFIHILILIFIWSAITTAWSYMGRFGLASFGHGAVLGIGAYGTALLFNHYRLSPWIGMFIAALIAVFFFAGLAYFCFSFGVAGHYFAITTLVEAMVIYLLIINFRDITGGSLGLNIYPMGSAPLFFQFESKIYLYFISLAFLLTTLYVWKTIDKSRVQMALAAIDNDEKAASSLGISIVKYKTLVTAISAFFTALGGIIYAQYMMVLHPESIAGLHVAALGIPFKAIVGGVYSLWGPLVGTTLYVGLEEVFRIAYGAEFIGWSMAVFGVVFILLIIFLPKGLWGTFSQLLAQRRIVRR